MSGVVVYTNMENSRKLEKYKLYQKIIRIKLNAIANTTFL